MTHKITTAICYSAETLGPPREYNTDLSATLTHGVCVACWEVPGLCPLGAAAGHFSPFSPTRSLIDAERTAWTAQRYGDYSLIGADVNGPPLEGPPADITLMSQRDRAARFLDPLADPPQRPNRANAQALVSHGYSDAFTLLHRQTGDPVPGQDRAQRPDRRHPRQPAAGPRLTGGQLLDSPPDASDHRGLLVRIDTDLAGR